MHAPKELKFLRTIKTGKGLIKLILQLRLDRRNNKNPDHKRRTLTRKQRELVFEKTDGRCHVCGVALEINNFHADHVKAHITGGEHAENNYLPSCSTCNNLRWHHSPEEIQIMFKMGRWLKSQLSKDNEKSLELANQFVKHEMALRKKRIK